MLMTPVLPNASPIHSRCATVIDKAGAVDAVIVDGMNVIGSRPDGWWRDRDGAVRRLVARLQAHWQSTDDDVAVVLDGRPLDDLREGIHEGVEVMYARRAGRNAADDRIVELVRARVTSDDTRLTVVTSDQELSWRVRELGAEVIGARTFLARLDEA